MAFVLIMGLCYIVRIIRQICFGTNYSIRSYSYIPDWNSCLTPGSTYFPPCTAYLYYSRIYTYLLYYVLHIYQLKIDVVIRIFQCYSSFTLPGVS
jgi:hypothetical protein